MKKIEIKVKNNNFDYSVIIGNNILKILPKKIKLLCPNAQKIAIVADKESLAGINSGELDRFKALIQQKIQQNVNNQLCGLDRVELEFEISLMPTGDLLGEPKMTQSSKIASCDAAVERAILQSQPLPIPKDKKLFKRLKDLTLKFHPNGHYDL